LGDLSNIFGGGSSSSSGGNPLASLGSGLSSLFSGAGTAVSDAATGLGSALTPAASAQAVQQAVDPTGSIGAQETINPPGQGSPQEQQSSIGGTQSGGAPQPNQQQQTPAQQYAPQSAVDGLKKALTQLAQGQRQDPWNPQPQTYRGQQASQLPVPGALGQPAPQPAPLPQLTPGETGAASLPMPTPGETGPTSPQNVTDAGIRALPGAMAAGYGGIGSDAVAGQTADQADQPPQPPDTAAASTGPAPPPSATPTGPAPPSTVGGQPLPKKDDQGNDIVVKKKGPQAAAPTTADLPTKVPPPTHKPGLEPPTHKPGLIPPQPGPIMRDVTGGQAIPSALPQLAMAAMGMLLPMLLSGGFGGRHGRGGFRHFGGFHHGGEGHWPYHHPMQGWQMHAHHPGGGWLPLHPHHMRGIAEGGGTDPTSQMMQAMFGNSLLGQANQRQAGGDQTDGGDQTGDDLDSVGNVPPGRNQRDSGKTQFDASKVPNAPSDRGTPGVTASAYDNFTRSYASQIGMDPDTASKMLATESNFGQNIYGDFRDGKPTSFGGFQLHLAPDGKAMGDQYMRDTGHAPWDHKYWQEQVKYALDHAKKEGWGPWRTSMNKLGLQQWSGINQNAPNRTASAPAPAPAPAAQASAPDAVSSGAG
jgi:hypothetical protein